MLSLISSSCRRGSFFSPPLRLANSSSSSTSTEQRAQRLIQHIHMIRSPGVSWESKVKVKWWEHHGHYFTFHIASNHIKCGLIHQLKLFPTKGYFHQLCPLLEAVRSYITNVVMPKWRANIACILIWFIELSSFQMTETVIASPAACVIQNKWSQHHQNTQLQVETQSFSLS